MYSTVGGNGGSILVLSVHQCGFEVSGFIRV